MTLLPNPMCRLPLLLLSLCLTAAANAEGSGTSADLSVQSSDGLPRRLIVALDGIPFDAFESVQRDGHFSEFTAARRMISTFPSLTDVSFSAISGGTPPEGYQVMRFDPQRNRVVGNSLGSLSGKAHRHVPSDTGPRTVANRIWAYLTPNRSAARQLRRMRADFLASAKETFVAYIEATDSMLHIKGREDAERFLVTLDATLGEIQQEVLTRTGRSLAIDVVSDHGSTLGPGRTVHLKRTLRSCGFRRGRRLGPPRTVAYTRAGIIGSVSLSCDPAQAEEVARCVASDPAVGVVAFVRNNAVVVLDDEGEAEVRFESGPVEAYSYRRLRGDPLGLAEAAASERPRVATSEQWLRGTLDAKYPDAPARLWGAFHGSVQNPPQVLVSLRDGYESANQWVHWLARMRGRKGTHGSLTSLASLGVVASNWRPVDDVNVHGAHELLFGGRAFEQARHPNSWTN